MEKVRPWCGQPSDRGRLRNRTEQWVRYVRWYWYPYVTNTKMFRDAWCLESSDESISISSASRVVFHCYVGYVWNSVRYNAEYTTNVQTLPQKPSGIGCLQTSVRATASRNILKTVLASATWRNRLPAIIAIVTLLYCIVKLTEN